VRRSAYCPLREKISQDEIAVAAVAASPMEHCRSIVIVVFGFSGA
jgi:hypothetical protein